MQTILTDVSSVSLSVTNAPSDPSLASLRVYSVQPLSKHFDHLLFLISFTPRRGCGAVALEVGSGLQL